MKRKLTIFLGALFLALTLSVGTYAYTFHAATIGFDVTAAGGPIVTQEAAAPGDQPDWNEVLPQSEEEQEILFPDGPGSQNELDQLPETGQNWDKVDDPSPDDLDTYVYTDRHNRFDSDLYQLQNGTGAGDINGVTVYFRFAGENHADAEARAYISTYGDEYHGTTYESNEEHFTTRSETWTVNPTTNEPWTWTEINTLEAGVELQADGRHDKAYCTQVFVVIDYELPPIIEGEAPPGEFFIINPNPDYTGDLLVNIYLTNTGLLKLCYQHLNMKLYVEHSLEADKDPEYQVLSLENGVATFNLEGGSATIYRVQVIGGGYSLISGDPYEWGEGWTHIPEVYCEVVQR
ncbi:hypothetical protein ACFLXH_06285 [Chloroflexota bacterium]